MVISNVFLAEGRILNVVLFCIVVGRDKITQDRLGWIASVSQAGKQFLKNKQG